MTTWSSDMTPPRKPSDALGAVQWNPEELELDGAPFGGPQSSFAPSAHHHEAAHFAQQQALDEAFTQGFDAGREAGATAERARLESAHTAVISLLVELREREARWIERIEENLC